MWPRKLLDITWKDIAFGGKGFVSRDNGQRQRRILEEKCGGQTQAMVCLSVRTGFDLFLQALQLPKGSEVIMTAITIPHMIEIVRRHGLVPVPLDLGFTTLAPSVDALQRSLSPLTRLIVVAHLFGVKSPISPILEIAKKNDLIVVEDCAQSFDGHEAMNCSDADGSFYSFGPIKTATALGGAIVRVRDGGILAEMRRRHDLYPVQRQLSYAVRLVKYTMLKIASHRMLYGSIMHTCRFLKRDPDLLVNSLARNFGKRDLIDNIRRQPCNALVGMLTQRWRSYDSSRLASRIARGEYLKSLIKDSVAVPGSRAERHSYWVFPIVVDSAELMIELLRQHGFDVTSSHNLTSLHVVADGSNRDAPIMAQMLRNIVFLPIYPEMTYEAIERMAHIITHQVGDRFRTIPSQSFDGREGNRDAKPSTKNESLLVSQRNNDDQ